MTTLPPFVAWMLAEVKGLLRQSEAPFGSRHRIRTTTGDIRNVVVVGDAVTDADGRITATRGFYVDIPAAFNTDLQHSITNELQVIVPQRAIIEQAKGMLMVTYQVSADAAFGILRWRSQEHNVKLATIAERLVADLPALHSGHPALRAPVDHYLMTRGNAKRQTVPQLADAEGPEHCRTGMWTGQKGTLPMPGSRGSRTGPPPRNHEQHC